MKDRTKPWLYYLIAACAGLALLHPLLPRLAPGGPIMLKAAAFQSLALLAGAAWALLAASDRRYRPNWRSPLVIAGLAWLAWLIVTLPFTVDPELTFWADRRRMMGVWANLHWIIWLIALGSTFKSWKEWRWLLTGSCLVAAVVGITGFAELIDPKRNSWRIVSILGNSMYLAYYMLPHVFFALILAIRAERWRWRIPAGLLTAFYFLTIIQSGTRGAAIFLLAGLAAIGLGYLLMFARRRRRARLSVLGLIGLILLLSALVGSYRFSADFRASTVKYVPKAINRMVTHDFGSDRLELWRIGLQGWQDRPLIGRGLENYGEILDRYIFPTDTHLTHVWYDKTHNQFLDIALGAGAIGLLLYLLLWAAPVFLLIRAMRSSRKFDCQSRLTFWVLAVLVLAQAGALFFAFETIPAGMAYWTAVASVLGLTAASRPSENEPNPETDAPLAKLTKKQRRRAAKEAAAASRKQEKSPPDGSLNPALVTVVLLAAAAFSYWANWRPYLQAVRYEPIIARAHAQPSQAAEEIEDLFADRSFVLPELRLNLIDRIRSLSVGLQLNRAGLKPLFEAAVREIGRTLETREYSFKHSLAGAYINRELAGYDPAKLEEARRLCGLAIAAAPNRPDGYEELADIEISAGNLDAAWFNLEIALNNSRFAYTTGRIRMRRAAVQAMRGNLDEAESEIAAAKKVFEIGLDFRPVLELASSMRDGEPREEILDYYRRAVERRPSHPVALYAYTLAAAKHGDLDLAVTLLERLKKIDPRNAENLKADLNL